METKNQRRKIFWKFILIMLICALAGGTMGFLLTAGGQRVTVALEVIMAGLQQYAVIAQFALLVLPIVAACFYFRGRQLAAAADPLQDDAYGPADRSYGLAMNWISAVQVLSFTCFGVGLTGGSGVPLMIQTAAFLCTEILALCLQNLCIKATKALYPEKRGNLLDVNFQKDWLDSCDEAELQMIGRAAYKSMAATQHAILLAFLLTMFLSLSGLMTPVVPLAIGVIWFVQVQSYMVACRKLEHKNQSRK